MAERMQHVSSSHLRTSQPSCPHSCGSTVLVAIRRPALLPAAEFSCEGVPERLDPRSSSLQVSWRELLAKEEDLRLWRSLSSGTPRACGSFGVLFSF